MKKKNLNFLIDALAYVAFVFLLTTGLLVRYTLPPGSGHHTTLWGLDRHQWGDMHFWISIAFLALLVLHLFLHWKWLFSLISGRPRSASGTRFLMGMAAVVGILLIGFSPFFGKPESRTISNNIFRKNRLKLESPGSERSFRRQQDQTPHQIRNEISSTEKCREPEQYNQPANIEKIAGYMTLDDVEAMTRVPKSHIISTLSLPTNISTTEKLGRLKREYGFEIQEVRAAVASYP